MFVSDFDRYYDNDMDDIGSVLEEFVEELTKDIEYKNRLNGGAAKANKKNKPHTKAYVEYTDNKGRKRRSLVIDGVQQHLSDEDDENGYLTDDDTGIVLTMENGEVIKNKLKNRKKKIDEDIKKAVEVGRNINRDIENTIINSELSDDNNSLVEEYSSSDDEEDTFKNYLKGGSSKEIRITGTTLSQVINNISNNLNLPKNPECFVSKKVSTDNSSIYLCSKLIDKYKLGPIINILTKIENMPEFVNIKYPTIRKDATIPYFIHEDDYEETVKGLVMKFLLIKMLTKSNANYLEQNAFDDIKTFKRQGPNTNTQKDADRWLTDDNLSTVLDGLTTIYPFEYLGIIPQNWTDKWNSYEILDKPDLTSRLNIKKWVYTIDKEKTYAAIHNTGEHWVCIFIDPSTESVTYFDSVANEMPKKTMEFLLTLSNELNYKLDTTNRVIQNCSVECGMYCILYILLRLEKFTHNQIINLSNDGVCDEACTYLRQVIFTQTDNTLHRIAKSIVDNLVLKV